MPDIGTSLHFLIANKIYGFLVWFKKLGRNLKMEEEGFSYTDNRKEVVMTCNITELLLEFEKI